MKSAIIDSHAHLTKRQLYDRGSKELLLTEMKRSGVSTALLMGESLANSIWFSTKELLKEVEDSPNLKVIAGIDTNDNIKKQLQDYETYIKEKKIVGFKLYPGYQYCYPADPKLAPIYDMAAREKIPVVIHTGDLFTEGASQPPLLKYSHPLNVDEAAALHPKVTFIIAHLGNPWITDATEVVYKNSNVYADLSGLFAGIIDDDYAALVTKRLTDAIAYLGSTEKFLFGTDWPLIGHDEYISFFKKVIPKKNQEAFFSGNTKRLFRL
jgi:predicted TIM-barrel fold metal-dependent hydrolase